MRLTVSLFFLVATGLSGCSGMLNTADSSDYGCPGMPAGVTCKRPLEVYRRTNGVDFDRPVETAYSDRMKVAATIPAAPQVPAAPVVPKPMREAPQIMRIWVAPWITAKDDLYFPSYIYTEVQPRRWAVGNADFTVMQQVVPHRADAQMERSAPKEAAAPAAQLDLKLE